MRIEYESDNGYSGVLYGKSSMIIRGPDKRTILHTGFRTPNTFDELREIVDDMPEFVEKLNAMIQKQNVHKK